MLGGCEIMTEEKVLSEPDALVAYLQALKINIDQEALEAGPLSQWLHAGLVSAGFDTELLETRHVKAALSAMTIKTDRHDARGIAQDCKISRCGSIVWSDITTDTNSAKPMLWDEYPRLVM